MPSTQTPGPGPQVPIRELRLAHSLTIEQLRDRIEVYLGKRPHGDTLRNVELGRRRASAPLMNAWARALNIAPLDVTQPTEHVSEQVSA